MRVILGLEKHNHSRLSFIKEEQHFTQKEEKEADGDDSPLCGGVLAQQGVLELNGVAVFLSKLNLHQFDNV